MYKYNWFVAGAASTMTSAQRKEAEANGGFQGAQVCTFFKLVFSLIWIAYFQVQNGYYDPNNPSFAYVPPPAYNDLPPSYGDSNKKND